MDGVKLWLQTEVFDYGIIHSHPKLGTSYLKKVISYAKSKGQAGGYPMLNWAIWKHMAVNKMLLPQDLAWTYFEVFGTLSQKSKSKLLENAELLQQSCESGDTSFYRNQIMVPTLQFVVFLYLQQANKVSLRKSVLGDEWPGTSPRLSRQSKSESAIKMLDEKKHIQFVSTHLKQIVDILSEGNSKKESTSADSKSTLSLDVVKAIGYFIRGRAGLQTAILNLHEIALIHQIQAKCGYSKSNACFDKQNLLNWVSSCLAENPYGLVSCLTSGVRLKWFPSHGSNLSDTRKPKILTNAQTAPSGNRRVVFSQCSGFTIARQSLLLVKNHVKLHRCDKSHIYLLAPLRSVSIEKCSGSTFVLGPVSTCIKLVGCQDVTVIAPCRSISINASSGVTLYITTPTQPILTSDNHSSGNNSSAVTFAPYNTFYSSLESDLIDVGLAISPETDQWNNPICVDDGVNLAGSSRHVSDGNGSLSGAESSLFQIMTPEEFYLFSIPFKTKHAKQAFPTTEVPGGLPPEYDLAVKTKQRATDRWKRAVRESNLSKDERLAFQELVENKFKQWVLDTGNQKELDDLGCNNMQ